MQKLSALDEFFLLDNDKNRANIITIVKIEKIKEVARVRQNLIDKAMMHQRKRSSLKKFFGEYFFIEMNADQLRKA